MKTFLVRSASYAWVTESEFAIGAPVHLKTTQDDTLSVDLMYVRHPTTDTVVFGGVYVHEDILYFVDGFFNLSTGTGFTW